MLSTGCYDLFFSLDADRTAASQKTLCHTKAHHNRQTLTATCITKKRKYQTNKLYSLSNSVFLFRSIGSSFSFQSIRPALIVVISSPPSLHFSFYQQCYRCLFLLCFVVLRCAVLCWWVFSDIYLSFVSFSLVKWHLCVSSLRFLANKRLCKLVTSREIFHVVYPTLFSLLFLLSTHTQKQTPCTHWWRCSWFYFYPSNWWEILEFQHWNSHKSTGT